MLNHEGKGGAGQPIVEEGASLVRARTLLCPEGGGRAAPARARASRTHDGPPNPRKGRPPVTRGDHAPGPTPDPSLQLHCTGGGG